MLPAGRGPVDPKYDLDRLAGLLAWDGRLTALAQCSQDLLQLPPVCDTEGFVFTTPGEGLELARGEHVLFANGLPDRQPRPFQRGATFGALYLDPEGPVSVC